MPLRTSSIGARPSRSQPHGGWGQMCRWRRQSYHFLPWRCVSIWVYQSRYSTENHATCSWRLQGILYTSITLPAHMYRVDPSNTQSDDQNCLRDKNCGCHSMYQITADDICQETDNWKTMPRYDKVSNELNVEYNLPGWLLDIHALQVPKRQIPSVHAIDFHKTMKSEVQNNLGALS